MSMIRIEHDRVYAIGAAGFWLELAFLRLQRELDEHTLVKRISPEQAGHWLKMLRWRRAHDYEDQAAAGVTFPFGADNADQNGVSLQPL